MDMKAPIIRIEDRSFVAVEQSKLSCRGCAGDELGASNDAAREERRKLCYSLPRCASNEGLSEGMRGVIFKEVDADAVPGPMTTAQPEGAVLYTEDPDHGDPAVPDALAYKPAHGGHPATSMPLANAGHNGRSGHAPALARTTDPQTSHDAAAKVGGGKLQDLILATLQAWRDKDLAAGEAVSGGTGKELADHTGRPLNSITPRFAALRRMGLIHASGRRDKQIVWKLGNGVA
jgi:hypothetical protein